MSDRKNFGRLRDVLPIPDLIEIQTKSFDDFLQLNVAPGMRENKGLQEVFRDIFSADSTENGSGLEFLSYEVEEPRKSIVDCLKDGETYQAAMYANFHLRLPNQKESKEERISLGDMPLMTEKGSFVINGVERVIVSQLHRSPGVCFEKTKHASGKDLFIYKIVADHGSWMDVQFDTKDNIYIYLDRHKRSRKFLISQFLRAFGYQSDRELLNAVYRYFYLNKNSRRLVIDGKYNDERRNRLMPLFGTLTEKKSAAEKAQTSEVMDEIPDWLGVEDVKIKDLLELDDKKLGKIYTVEPVNDPADEEVELIERFSPISRYALETARDAGVEMVGAVDTTGMGDSFINCIKKEYDDLGHAPTPEDARKEIYRKLRPSDAPTESNAKGRSLR